MTTADIPVPAPKPVPLRSWVRRTALAATDPFDDTIRVGASVKCISAKKKEHEIMTV